MTVQTTMITVTVGRLTHTGVFAVSDGLITVLTLYGSKTRELGQSPPETLAWLMMLELVRQEIARRDEQTVWPWPPPSVDCRSKSPRAGEQHRRESLIEETTET